ncbi:hypothetical protein COV16_00845 [Candidatus Woesearchaeota archaeon CG10_big_fil_rev_8_21_14_0_10_34_8]|nr:MAG: hypothetical protein COV16_00845 [Candidatus Woesearchaeota archaeon CG10_big_fil_rev_8_21_14_0_10_34_8]
MDMIKLKKRELMIKLKKEGRSYREIGKILGVSKSTVSFWLGRHKNKKSLKDMPRKGRPSIISKRKLHIIIQIIKQASLNSKTGISSKKALEIIKEETGKIYSLRHVQRLLYKLGLSSINSQAYIKHNKRNNWV